MKYVVVAIGLLSAIGWAAGAQTPVPAVLPKPSPEAIAAARAEADRILAASGAKEEFDNVTSTSSPMIRHKLSGAVCLFDASGPDNKLVPEHGEVLRTHGFICHTKADGVDFNLRVIDIGMGWDMDFKLGLNAITSRIPDVKLIKEPFGDMTPMVNDKPLFPPSRTGRFSGTLGRQPVFARVQVVQWKGWTAMLDTVAPLDTATQTDILAGMTFINALKGAKDITP
jgi:hypothetical protein